MKNDDAVTYNKFAERSIVFCSIGWGMWNSSERNNVQFHRISRLGGGLCAWFWSQSEEIIDSTVPFLLRVFVNSSMLIDVSWIVLPLSAESNQRPRLLSDWRTLCQSFFLFSQTLNVKNKNKIYIFKNHFPNPNRCIMNELNTTWVTMPRHQQGLKRIDVWLRVEYIADWISLKVRSS